MSRHLLVSIIMTLFILDIHSSAAFCDKRLKHLLVYIYHSLVFLSHSKNIEKKSRKLFFSIILGGTLLVNISYPRLPKNSFHPTLRIEQNHVRQYQFSFYHDGRQKSAFLLDFSQRGQLLVSLSSYSIFKPFICFLLCRLPKFFISLEIHSTSQSISTL